MAKTCIQCGKKIGLFKKPVDTIYCSVDCSVAAQKEIAENEKRSEERRVEAERLAAEQARRDQKEAKVAEAQQRALHTCPKCGHPWTYMPGGGGDCDAAKCKPCGFSATFSTIDLCPSCNGRTLVVSPAEGSRCPRCKYRG